MSKFTGVLNAQFKKLGFHIKKHSPNHNWLKNAQLNSIIDIGANIGEYSNEMAEILPNVKIYAFEPVAKCFEILKKSTKNLNIELFPYALGDEEGEQEINVHQHAPSSSLLVMEDSHEKAFPDSIKSEKEKIVIKKLDDIFANKVLEKNTLIKIDVQGFEDKVILGGTETIKKAKFIIIEMTYTSLYKGQPLFDDIYQLLRGLGFIFHGNTSDTLDPESGIMLFGDSLFVNTKL